MRLSDLWSKPIPPPPEPTIDDLHEEALRIEDVAEYERVTRAARERVLTVQQRRERERREQDEREWQAEYQRRLAAEREAAIEARAEKLRRGELVVARPGNKVPFAIGEPVVPKDPPVKVFIQPPDYGGGASGHRLPMGTGHAYRPPHF